MCDDNQEGRSNQVSHWDEAHTESLIVTVLHEVQTEWSEFKANVKYVLDEGRWLVVFLTLAIITLMGVVAHQSNTISKQKEVIRQLSGLHFTE